MKSDFLSINWRDLGKGAVVALITAALASISLAIEAGQLPTVAQLKTAGLAGIVAAIAYIIKNFFTDSTAEAKKRIEAKGGTVIE